MSTGVTYPVTRLHYALLYDHLLACQSDDGEGYYWELTSDDLLAAVFRARCWLDADSDAYLSAAVHRLDLVKCRVLLYSGVKPGRKTYLRLLEWYRLDRLDHAQRRRRREMLRRLLDGETYPCFRENFETAGRETLLHAMCGSCTPLEDIKMLLAAGACAVISHSDPAGNTPLHRYAARDFHHRRCPPTLKGFELLLDHGAEVNVTNGDGHTAYQLVLGNNPQKYRARRCRLARFLEDNGAETNIQPGP